MIGDPGRRRSTFKVDMHLGEHASADEALSAWPGEIRRLREIGRENAADKLEAKVETLLKLMKGES
jgi:hypothetical protein